MSNILHDSMFCDTIMAMILVMQNLHLDMSKRQSVAILYHSNNALSKLLQRLSSPEEMYSDAMI
jgi:hypothetical protein